MKKAWFVVFVVVFSDVRVRQVLRRRGRCAAASIPSPDRCTRTTTHSTNTQTHLGQQEHVAGRVARQRDELVCVEDRRAVHVLGNAVLHQRAQARHLLL